MYAVDVSRIARSSTSSGAKGVEDLAAAGHHGTNPKNLARDLLRTLVRGSNVPKLFWHEVRGWDPVNKEQTTVSLQFLLPHEVLHSFTSKLEHLKLDQAKYPEIAALFHTKCKKLGLDPNGCLPWGFMVMVYLSQRKIHLSCLVSMFCVSHMVIVFQSLV